MQDRQTQKTGIEQWDKMESLIEKVEENKENKEFINKLYEKILMIRKKEQGIDRE